MEINFVTSRLAVGSSPETEADIYTLINHGITHIIQCSSNSQTAELLNLFDKIAFMHNTVDDDGKVKPAGWFQRSIEFCLVGLTSPKVKIFIHCKEGINRGPSTMYAVLRSLGLSPEVASDLIKKARPIAGMRYNTDADNAIKVLGYE